MTAVLEPIGGAPAHATVVTPAAKKRRRETVRAMTVLSVIVGLAVLGPTLAPASPNRQDLVGRLKPPVFFGGTWEHAFGTDYLGRDVLSRLLHGARLSLIIAAVVVLLSALLGTTVGILAGYKRGIWEMLIMRTVDVWVALPTLIIALVVLVSVGASTTAVIIVITLSYWMVYAQVARTTVLTLSSSGYVEAARICGVSSGRIMRHHVLPGVLQPISVVAVLEFSKVMLAEATLSFLGFGVQPPDASWGLDISLGRPYILSAWWLVTLPGIALMMTVLGVHFIGTWLGRTLEVEER